MKKSLNERFWKKVAIIPFHECWEWIGTKKLGYGRMFPDLRAHRVSWIIHNGPIPKGLVVCHKCDNPGCVRIDHLFLGTMSDNNKDRDIKDRTNKGENKWSCKLKEQDVLKIRELAIISDLSLSSIGKMYGIGKSHVSGIIKRKKWSYLK